ncbi:MAG: hypothetical protein AAGF71_04110 [Pseudomonadota bacterium]
MKDQTPIQDKTYEQRFRDYLMGIEPGNSTSGKDRQTYAHRHAVGGMLTEIHAMLRVLSSSKGGDK